MLKFIEVQMQEIIFRLYRKMIVSDLQIYIFLMQIPVLALGIQMLLELQMEVITGQRLICIIPQIIHNIKCHFLDDNKGWIVDSRSKTVFKSTNGGINWFLNNYQMQFDTVRYVCTAQPGIVKIIGNHTIASSSNGGNNWSALQSSKFGICFFFDINSGWIFSQGDLLKTTNGGLNWEMNLHQTSYLHFGVFLNLNTGWVTETILATQTEIHLLITNNGGTNWQTFIYR